jgi:hypothetical protein
MKEEVFVTAESVTAESIGGHLEYTGTPLQVEGSNHCWRREVRETLAGFEVYDVRFTKFHEQWREAARLKYDVYQSKAEAIDAVREQRGWWGAVGDDLKEQRDRERIEAGHELASMLQGRAKGIQRDIVEMVYDDGLTPKEALDIERQHRAELAREFREAVDALRTGMLQETTCDWCGVDLQTVKNHRMVDGQPMCLPCVSQYSLEEGKDYER